MRLEPLRWLGLLLSLSLIGLLSCSKGDDESAIRQLIKEGAELAETHDIGGITSLVTDDFRAFPGEIDRRGTKGILWRTFKYYGELRVLYPQPDVEIREDGGSASANLPFLIVSREKDVPELQDFYEDPRQWVLEAGKIADLYRFKLDLIKRDDHWLVKSAMLEKFKGLGFGE